MGWAQGGRDRRAVGAELRLRCPGFTTSFQGDGLHPWDSEPPGGMFPPVPEQLLHPNSSLSDFLKLWMKLKHTRLSELNLQFSV